MNASSFANQHFGWQKLEELIAYIVFLISYDGIIRDEQERMKDSHDFYRIYSQLLTLLQILNYFSYLMNYSFNNTFASIFNS